MLSIRNKLEVIGMMTNQPYWYGSYFKIDLTIILTSASVNSLELPA